MPKEFAAGASCGLAGRHRPLAGSLRTKSTSATGPGTERRRDAIPRAEGDGSSRSQRVSGMSPKMPIFGSSRRSSGSAWQPVGRKLTARGHSDARQDPPKDGSAVMSRGILLTCCRGRSIADSVAELLAK
jgi:hypothetical protein